MHFLGSSFVQVCHHEICLTAWKNCDFIYHPPFQEKSSDVDMFHCSDLLWRSLINWALNGLGEALNRNSGSCPAERRSIVNQNWGIRCNSRNIGGAGITSLLTHHSVIKHWCRMRWSCIRYKKSVSLHYSTVNRKWYSTLCWVMLKDLREVRKISVQSYTYWSIK